MRKRKCELGSKGLGISLAGKLNRIAIAADFADDVHQALAQNGGGAAAYIDRLHSLEDSRPSRITHAAQELLDVRVASGEQLAAARRLGIEVAIRAAGMAKRDMYVEGIDGHC